MASFLTGSLPTGYLTVRALKGVDVRTMGSGNVGATNVMRAAGKGAAAFTLVVDIAKGYLPVLVALRFFPENPGFAAALGFAAIAGHNWTPFLNFKGGKGVATSIGVFLALLPMPSLIALGVFGIALFITRTVSLSSLVASVAHSAATIILTRSKFFSGLSIFAVILLFILHRRNIARILKGEEPKI